MTTKPSPAQPQPSPRPTTALTTGATGPGPGKPAPTSLSTDKDASGAPLDPTVRDNPKSPHPTDPTDSSRSNGPLTRGARAGDPGALPEQAATIIGDHLRGIKRALGDAAAAWDREFGRRIHDFLLHGLGPNNAQNSDFHRGVKANVERPEVPQAAPPQP